MTKSKKRSSAQRDRAPQGSRVMEFINTLIARNPSRRQELTLFLVCLLSVVLYVFWDFVTFKRVYLFKDIASDSINGLYPHFVHLVNYMKTVGIPKWSFNQGLGQNIFPLGTGDPFMIVFYLLGSKNLVFGLAYVEILKIVFGGLFFYRYLRVLGVTNYAALIGALLFSFAGYIIVGGNWYHFSFDAMCAALLLYSFEKFFKQGVWYLLPLPFVLLGSYQPFYLYLYGLFLFGYGTIRFLDEREWSVKGFSLFAVKMAGLFLLGTVVSSVFLFSNVLQLVQSPRVGGESSYFHFLMSQPVFDFAPQIEYLSLLARSFSSDLLGTGSDFRGWTNYLESPLTYCGLACLVLAPQFFCFQDRRHKVQYSILVALFLIPLVFPFFRYLFWGFTGDYFRTYSFFIAILLLYFSIRALGAIDKGARVSVKVLSGSFLVLAGILFLPPFDSNGLIDRDLRSVVMLFLILYAVFLLLMNSKSYKTAAKAGMLICVCVELSYLSGISIKNRDSISSDSWRQRTGYNDYTREAVEYLNSIDTTFFRVDKDYYSGMSKNTSLNDGKVQNYYGTTSYSSFNQVSFIRFLQQMDLIDAQNELSTRWAGGIITRPVLGPLVSCKYVLSKGDDQDLRKRSYVELKSVGDVHIMKNPFYLPLGIAYERLFLSTGFSRLTPAQKDISLLRGFVVDAASREKFPGFPVIDLHDSTGMDTLQDLRKDLLSLRDDTLSMIEHGQNAIRGTIDLKKNKLLFFSIPYDKGWSATVDGRETTLEVVNIGFMGVPLTAGHHTVELRFEPPYLATGAAVSGFSIVLYAGLYLAVSRIAARRRAAAQQEIPPAAR